MSTTTKSTTKSKQVPKPSRELRDSELKEVTGGVYVGPSQSALVTGLLPVQRVRG
jgi:hypothetical protein